MEIKGNIVIRQAVKEDARKIIEYLETIAAESDYLSFGEGEFHVTVKQEEAFLEDHKKQKNSIYLVAETDGIIIGCSNLTGGLKPRNFHTAEFGISVQKDYWGKHVGKTLMQEIIKLAKDEGVIKKINLLVRSDNTKAIHLYYTFGFVEEGLITKDLFIDGVYYDSIMMGLWLD
ncbi:GNAT family N-acetyltransferase [Terrilactibacillus laevilacticus]|uniref:GNAT family N-acetyltransferase n=1 Tax=Terrilactibacillus laevilacticus TaxID=1380157 RepID=A0ABW5PSF5_9BACI|nr:GNAT family protein [Terrilactibacillus laevilacticus]